MRSRVRSSVDIGTGRRCGLDDDAADTDIWYTRRRLLLPGRPSKSDGDGACVKSSIWPRVRGAGLLAPLPCHATSRLAPRLASPPRRASPRIAAPRCTAATATRAACALARARRLSRIGRRRLRRSTLRTCLACAALAGLRRRRPPWPGPRPWRVGPPV